MGRCRQLGDVGNGEVWAMVGCGQWGGVGNGVYNEEVWTMGRCGQWGDVGNWEV